MQEGERERDNHKSTNIVVYKNMKVHMYENA